MKKNILFFYLFIFSYSVTFSQETFIHSACQVQVTIPVQWFYVLNEDGSMTIYSPDKQLALGFDIMEARDLDSAFKELGADLEKHFKDVKLDNPKEEEINGLKIVSIIGTANEGKIEIGFALIITPNFKILALGSTSTPEASKKYEKQFADIIHSVRPFDQEKE